MAEQGKVSRKNDRFAALVVQCLPDINISEKTIKMFIKNPQELKRILEKAFCPQKRFQIFRTVMIGAAKYDLVLVKAGDLGMKDMDSIKGNDFMQRALDSGLQKIPFDLMELHYRMPFDKWLSVIAADGVYSLCNGGIDFYGQDIEPYMEVLFVLPRD